jgi:hypothetical protein
MRACSTVAPKYSHHRAAVSTKATTRQSTTVDVSPAAEAVAPVTTIDSPRAMMMNSWQRSAKWVPSMS